MEFTDQPADTVQVEEDEISFSEIINLEMRLLRAEMKQLQEEQNELIVTQADRSTDRIGALDQRMLTLESRLNAIYSEVGQVENNFAIAIAVMIAIALLTIATVWIIRIKTIDPVALQTARLKAELQTAKGHELRQALIEMAENDPYLAQVLKKHGVS